MKYFAFILVMLVIASCNNPSSNTLESTRIDFAGLEFSSPTGKKASLPHLVKGDDGNLYLSWVEKKDSNWVEFKYSMLDGTSWTQPETISKGNNWFVNWADYPQIAIDKAGNMIAHYLVKSSSGTYSYDVNVVIKPALGKHWSSPVIPHNDGTPTEHGFVTILPQNNDTFLLSWLDGRNTNISEHSETQHGSSGAMTVRTAAINMNGDFTDEMELDNRVCDCCQTSGAMTESGPLIIYRDRSMEEIRDMSFVRKINGKWTNPKSVAKDNWNIDGCPVNGPRIATLNDQSAVAWFTAADERPTVKVAFSHDESFHEPITVDDQTPIGRVDIVMINEQSVMVSWMTSDGEKTVIKARKVSKKGDMESPFTVAETNSSRGSGFPQMEKIDNEIYFAWTNLIEDESTILIKTLKPQ